MRGCHRFLLAAYLAIGLATSARAALTLEFIPETAGYPTGTTADGNKAVINLSAGGVAIWQHDAPAQVVTGLSGYQYTHSMSISGDGTVVIGRSHGIGQIDRAFRWTQATGAMALPDALAPSGATWATALSSDGSVVVGYTLPTPLFPDAWRWTAVGGFQRLAGYEAYNSSSAQGVSADGSIIVGTVGTSQPEGSLSRAFQWTEASGFRVLPNSPFRSGATDISTDGSVIVGAGEFSSGGAAFRWTEAGGFQQLDPLANEDSLFITIIAQATSADGSVIVGQGMSFAPGGDYEAWIWDQQNGVRALTDAATQMGLDLQGHVLVSAAAISADGTVIYGQAWGPEGGVGYRLEIPEPATLTMLMGFAAIALMRSRRSR